MASLNLNITGASSPYVISVKKTGDVTERFQSFVSGVVTFVSDYGDNEYTITVNKSGCTSDSEVFTLNCATPTPIPVPVVVPTPIPTSPTPVPISCTLSISSVNVVCVGDSNGTITVNANNPSGYTLQYQLDSVYSWQSSNVFTGIANGSTYTVRVRNASNTSCEAVQTNVTVSCSVPTPIPNPVPITPTPLPLPVPNPVPIPVTPTPTPVSPTPVPVVPTPITPTPVVTCDCRLGVIDTDLAFNYIDCLGNPVSGSLQEGVTICFDFNQGFANVTDLGSNPSCTCGELPTPLPVPSPVPIPTPVPVTPPTPVVPCDCHLGGIANMAVYEYTDCNGNFFSGTATEGGIVTCFDINQPSVNVTDNGTNVACSCGELPTPIPTPVPVPVPVTPTPTPIPVAPTPVPVAPDCNTIRFTINTADLTASDDGVVHYEYEACEGSGITTGSYSSPGNNDVCGLVGGFINLYILVSGVETTPSMSSYSILGVCV